MSLDKRLKDLKIDPYILKDATKLSGEDIEAIKQAFIEENWRDLGSIGADFYDYDKKRFDPAEGVNHD